MWHRKANPNLPQSQKAKGDFFIGKEDDMRFIEGRFDPPVLSGISPIEVLTRPTVSDEANNLRYLAARARVEGVPELDAVKRRADNYLRQHGQEDFVNAFNRIPLLGKVHPEERKNTFVKTGMEIVLWEKPGDYRQ